MWKRVCAYVIGIPLAFFGAVYSYQWFSMRATRVEARKDLAESSVQTRALEALGEKNITLLNLTMEGLQARLGKPGMRHAGSENSSRLGWACGAKDCLIWATFAVPTNQVIPPNALAAALTLSDPYGYLFGSTERVSIDGAYLGEPIEHLRTTAKERGYGKDVGYNRITWDRDWSAIVVSDSKNKVTSLFFLKDPVLAKVAISNETKRN